MRVLIRAGLGAAVVTVALASVASPEARNPKQTAALRKYLKENFGYPGMETSWYRHIGTVSVAGKTVAVNTKINAKSAPGKEAAKGICGAVSGYAFSNQNRALGLEHIQVLGTGGVVVVSRRGAGDQCKAR